MHLNRRTTAACLTIWCLLASWLCFSGLELLEQVNLIPETAVEDQDGQDLDEAALSQLASGLKSNEPSHDVPYGASLLKKDVEQAVWLSVYPVLQFGGLIVHQFPSLRLHQQLSVYRI